VQEIKFQTIIKLKKEPRARFQTQSPAHLRISAQALFYNTNVFT